MKPRDDFHDYLRSQVVTAGQDYDGACEALGQLMNSSGSGNTKEIASSAWELLEASRVYIGALRRLAHYSANEEERHQKAMAKTA